MPAAAYVDGPVAALRRIAFLLERSRAETYKVKAFRAAAATILPLDPDEVVTRVREGTLREDCVVDGVVSDSHVYGLLRRDRSIGG